MSAKIIGENVQFRIEVEDRPKAVLLVLDRKCDWCVVSHEDAERLADTIDQVIKDVRVEFTQSDAVTMEREQAQVQLNHHKGLVAILVEWTDRLTFTSLEALFLVGRAIRKTAQDALLDAKKGVKIRYDRRGMIAKLHNMKTGVTQHVR